MSTSAPSANLSEKPPLVMQLIVDGACISSFGWPKGPWMAQSAHAAIAAIQLSSSSPSTAEYVSASNLGAMHKVVLQTPSEGKQKMSLQQLSEKLTEARKRFEEQQQQQQQQQQQFTQNGQHDSEQEEFPLHYLWIEQPENIPTCLAIAPNRKPAELKKILRPCTLLKD